MMIKINYIITTIFILLCLLVPSANAWSSGGSTNGHTIITTGAIKHLPQPLYDFFNRNSAIIITDSTIEPSPSYSHYIDIDWYPEFTTHTFPHDMNVLVTRYGLSTVQDNGTGPWALEAAQNQLCNQMQSATTLQDWIDLLATAGTLAHYTEDLHNPMHLTVNYNPDGLHSRYETKMISYHFAELAPVANSAGCAYLPSVIDSVFSQIDIDYAYNANILSADSTAKAIDPDYKTAYYNSLWAGCGAFTIQLFQDASEQLASEWYTAWINAGSPNPPCYYTLAGDLDGDCAVDISDLNIFVQQWLNTCSTPNWCDETDIDHSTMVDFQDLVTIISNWLTDCYDSPIPSACID